MPLKNHTLDIDPGVLKRMRDKDRDDGIGAWFDKGNTIDLRPNEEEDDDFMELPEESKIGTRLTNVTIKKVILIVLLLMMSTPMFSSTYYFTDEIGVGFEAEQWGAVVQSMSVQGNMTQQNYNEASAYFLREKWTDIEYPILNMSAKFLNDPSNKYIYIWTAGPAAFAGLRNSEKNLGIGSIEAITMEGKRQVETRIQISLRSGEIFKAWLGLAKTFTVCILLTICSMSFTNDFNAFI